MQGKHGARGHEGIGESNLCIGTAMIWDGVKAASHQAKERISREMLASFGGNKRGYPLQAGQLEYDCRYSKMHGMPVTGGRGLRVLKPL